MQEGRKDPSDPSRAGRFALGEHRGQAAQFAGIGLQFTASLLLFLFAGQWLDRKLGTAPLFLMLGVFVGAGAAFYSMYRKLMAAQAREEAEKKAREGTDGPGRGGEGTAP